MADHVLRTTNHFYSQKDCIGRGATSNVYVGYHRSKSEKRALKISKSNNSAVQRDIQREIEALLSLKHENIVEFYGIEEEIESGKCVLVMEYCGGGSLFSLLQEPENKYGLDDQEYFILIQDLSAGLQSMLSHGFVHRDIKPGNILRSIRNDGRSIYKLSDFGTSRQQVQSHDDDRLMSLVGTEEYLHPRIYERAFISPDVRLKFSVGMDKWSLGVTLYHAACGSVPFQPFGGSRRHKVEMFTIISQKPRGKIRGFQENEGGDIYWCENLPVNCRLSLGLRIRVERILTGLLEKDEQHQWSYTRFFEEVVKLRLSTPVFLLNTTTFRYHNLYIDVNESFRLAYLKEVIALQTDINASSQTLYYDGQKLDNVVQLGASVKDFPVTSKELPIVLLDNTHASTIPDTEFVKLESVELMSGEGTLSSDYKSAVDMCNNLVRITSEQSNLKTCHQTLQNFVKAKCMHVQNSMNMSQKELTRISDVMSEKKSRLHVILEDSSLSQPDTKKDIRDKYQSAITTKVKSKQMEVKIEKQLQKVGTLLNDAKGHMKKVTSGQCVQCLNGFQHQLSEAKKVMEKMKHRRKSLSLNAIQELQVIDDRRKPCCGVVREMNKIYINAVERWKTCCQVNFTDTFIEFHKWKRICTDFEKALSQVEQEIANLREMSFRFESSLITLSAYSCREWALHNETKNRQSSSFMTSDSILVDSPPDGKTKSPNVNNESKTFTRPQKNNFGTIKETHDSILSDSGLEVQTPEPSHIARSSYVNGGMTTPLTNGRMMNTNGNIADEQKYNLNWKYSNNQMPKRDNATLIRDSGASGNGIVHNRPVELSAFNFIQDVNLCNGDFQTRVTSCDLPYDMSDMFLFGSQDYTKYSRPNTQDTTRCNIPNTQDYAKYNRHDTQDYTKNNRSDTPCLSRNSE